MNPTVKRLNTFSQVEDIYVSLIQRDFDPDEIRPLSSIRKSWSRNEYICYGLFEQEELIAYAFFIRRGRHFLMDYFAVSKAHRGEGYGSVFLSKLLSCIPDVDCILVEAQDPASAPSGKEMDELQRRIRFYLRNGCYDTGLTCRLFGVDYCLLNFSAFADLPASEIREIYMDMYQSMLPPAMFKRNFILN